MTTSFTANDLVRVLPSGSIIQYGPHNDRIYLMSLGTEAPETLSLDLIEMAKLSRYSKIFVKAPEQQAKPFLTNGYVEEARVPDFYSGQNAALFFGYYLDPDRALEHDTEGLDAILATAKAKHVDETPKTLDEKFTLRHCTPEDSVGMSEIYKRVFESYPFPIHDPNYLVSTMKSHVDYFTVEAEGQMVALSSAEIDLTASNVKMTDFATLPEWLGNRFARHLLAKMEQEMKAKGIKTAYTIARAASPGINNTFGRAGYHFSGRLKNNTNISGNIESMNVWYKPLAC